MIALGFGVAWAGYAVFMWGYCLVRDYNVTVPDLFKAVWPGQVKAAHTGSAAQGTGTTQAPGTSTAGGRG